MAQQTIGLGAAPNDGTGDDLRTAGGKINDNFTELYAANGAMPETVQDLVASLLVAGANVSLTYDDGAGTLTIDATATSSGIADFNEAVDDRVAALIVAGSGVTKTYNDVAGTLTLSVSVAGSYLEAADNLSDLADAATARSNLGVYSTAQVDAAVAGAGLAAAAASDVWTGTSATKAITPDALFDSAAVQTLTDGTTITPDFGAGLNFKVTLGGNRTLANPSNAKDGQSGVIRVTQDGTGSRTLAYGSNWRFPGGAATGGVLSTAAGSVDQIAYIVGSSGVIYATLSKAFAA